MQLWRRCNADQIDIVAANRLSPVVRKMTYSKFVSRRPGVLNAAARDRDDLCAFARLECRYLNAPCKSCPDDPDADSLAHTSNLHSEPPKRKRLPELDSLSTLMLAWSGCTTVPGCPRLYHRTSVYQTVPPYQFAGQSNRPSSRTSPIFLVNFR